MTELRKKITDELVRRNYSEGTVRSYLRSVQEFARYCASSYWRHPFHLPARQWPYVMRPIRRCGPAPCLADRCK